MVYGASTSLLTLADALLESGHAVDFVAWRGRDFEGDLRARGYRVDGVRVRTKIDLLAIAHMVRLFRERGVDVVHTHLSTSSVNGCLAARLAHIPSVATVHGMSGKLSFFFADRLIAVSNGVRDHLVAQGIDGQRIDVVYNAVVPPLTLPTRDVARRELGLDRADTIVGTVARTVAVKGYDDLLRAFAIVAENNPLAKFLCVGDGEGFGDFRALAKRLGLGDRIVWTGYRSDVWSALRAMDVFAFASHKEAMGIAVAEAMAAGLPIVSTDVGGLPEVLGQTGWLVPPHRPDRIATGILEAIAHHGDKGDQARMRAQDVFGRDTMRDATLDIYRRLTCSL